MSNGDLRGGLIKEIDIVKKGKKTIVFENNYKSKTEDELNKKVKEIFIKYINS